MAYKNIILSPNNVSNQASPQISQFYRGFSTMQADTLSNKLFDYALIKQDILNMFQTRKGERLMNPEFGTIIWDVIFDPFTDAVKQQIIDDVTRILNYDPRAVPIDITIIEAETGMIVDSTLLYVQTNQAEQMKFDFNANAGLVNIVE